MYKMLTKLTIIVQLNRLTFDMVEVDTYAPLIIHVYTLYIISTNTFKIEYHLEGVMNKC